MEGLPPPVKLERVGGTLKPTNNFFKALFSIRIFN
jgi:hypothetical protein